jgi:hypothetical protein
MRLFNVPLSLKPPLPLLLRLALVAPQLLPVAPVVLEVWSPTAVQGKPAVAASRSAWPVALPSTATVRLKKGGSLSGRLVKLTPTAVTLGVGQQSQTVALARVSTIEFVKPNDLWVSLPNGRRQQVRPIRGLSLPIEAVPSSAVQIIGPNDTATVDLTPVLSEPQFAKLNKDPGVVFVLSRVEVTAYGMLSLLVRPYRVE